MSDFNVNFKLVDDNKINGNFVLSSQEEGLIADFLLSESDKIDGLFTVNSIENITASFIYGTSPNINAIFKIDYYPMKTSELTNDSGFVTNIDLDTKVDKITGKGLSTNDLTNTLKSNYDSSYTHSQLITGNPHQVTKTDIGLGNVDNTSDVNKPISTATQNALNGKANLSGNLSQDFNANNLTIATSLNGYLLTDLVSGLKVVSFSGSVNGSNKVFTTDNAYDPLFITLNGVNYPTVSNGSSNVYYSYSGTTLTWNTAPSDNLILYANKGIFGLNSPVVLNINEDTDTELIKLLTGNSNTAYQLPSNAVGHSLNIINYSTTQKLKVFCYGQLLTTINSSSLINTKNLYVANTSLFSIGQDIMMDYTEVNTILEKYDNYFVLQNNLTKTYTSGNVIQGTVIEIPIVNLDGSNNIIVNNISSFTKIWVFASGNFLINIMGDVS